MKLLTLFAVATIAASSLSFAGAKCTAHPKAEWISPANAETKIKAMGYKITEFKMDDECYEIDGYDKDGKKVDVYFDTKTLDIVKSKIDN
ncbi:MAG: PepSY domain-containing protein [Deefgea sp.]